MVEPDSEWIGVDKEFPPLPPRTTPQRRAFTPRTTFTEPPDVTELPSVTTGQDSSGLIIGICGGIVLLVLSLTLFYCILRRKRFNQEKKLPKRPPSEYTLRLADVVSYPGLEDTAHLYTNTTDFAKLVSNIREHEKPNVSQPLEGKRDIGRVTLVPHTTPALNDAKDECCSNSVLGPSQSARAAPPPPTPKHSISSSAAFSDKTKKSPPRVPDKPSVSTKGSLFRIKRYRETENDEDKPSFEKFNLDDRKKFFENLGSKSKSNPHSVIQKPGITSPTDKVGKISSNCKSSQKTYTAKATPASAEDDLRNLSVNERRAVLLEKLRVK